VARVTPREGWDWGSSSSKTSERPAGSASGLAAATNANRCFYAMAKNWTLPIGRGQELIQTSELFSRNILGLV
jgi:hypothetical protein